MEKTYDHKLVQKAAELYEQYKSELGKGGGLLGMMWKALAPTIPQLLEEFDNSEGLRRDVKAFIRKIAEIVEEDDNE